MGTRYCSWLQDQGLVPVLWIPAVTRPLLVRTLTEPVALARGLLGFRHGRLQLQTMSGTGLSPSCDLLFSVLVSFSNRIDQQTSEIERRFPSDSTESQEASAFTDSAQGPVSLELGKWSPLVGQPQVLSHPGASAIETTRTKIVRGGFLRSKVREGRSALGGKRSDGRDKVSSSRL